MYNTEFLLSVSFAVNNGIAHSMYMAPLIKTEEKYCISLQLTVMLTDEGNSHTHGICTSNL